MASIIAKYPELSGIGIYLELIASVCRKHENDDLGYLLRGWYDRVSDVAMADSVLAESCWDVDIPF
jgi:hypothetical protein